MVLVRKDNNFYNKKYLLVHNKINNTNKEVS